MSDSKRNQAIIRTDKTLKEYREKFGHLYDKGSLISYTKKEYENRFNKPHSGSATHYRSNQIKEYWLINNSYYEVPKLTTSKKTNNKKKKAPLTKEELLERRKISFDMMHYRNNRSSFWLILLTIALNVAMFIIIYKTNTDKLKSDLQLGFDLIINVVFMLTAFLAAEKTKRYSREWGIVSFILGGIQVARIFWIPLYYYLNGGISSGAFSACVVLLAGGAACMFIAGALTLIKYRILKDHEPLIKKEGAKKDVRT